MCIMKYLKNNNQPVAEAPMLVGFDFDVDIDIVVVIVIVVVVVIIFVFVSHPTHF